MIPYAIEIYDFISYIVPFFGTREPEKSKKKFLGSHHRTLAFPSKYPVTP